MPIILQYSESKWTQRAIDNRPIYYVVSASKGQTGYFFILAKGPLHPNLSLDETAGKTLHLIAPLDVRVVNADKETLDIDLSTIKGKRIQFIARLSTLSVPPIHSDTLLIVLRER